MSFGLQNMIGADGHTILWWQMCIRAILIFFWTLLLIRLSSRIFGKFALLDIVISIILGSTLSRALTGNAAFVPTLAATLGLVLLHRLLVKASLHSKRIAELVKGKEILLVENGKISIGGLQKAGMTDQDLVEVLRLHGVDSTARIKAAYLERNGKVSIIL